MIALLLPVIGASSPEPNPPKWPDSVHVFSPGDDGECASVAAKIFETNGGMDSNGQFVSSRHALLFKPGTYSCAVPVGYYTQVRGGLDLNLTLKAQMKAILKAILKANLEGCAQGYLEGCQGYLKEGYLGAFKSYFSLYHIQVLGLGSSPDEVVFTDSKGVHCQEAGKAPSPGALDTFWRSAENFKTEADYDWITDKGMLWAVSQAAPLRRVHVTHSLMLTEVVPNVGAGYASGGFLADSLVDGIIQAGGQQQWLTRNVQAGAWKDGAWSRVFVGVEGAPDARCGGGSGNMVVVPKTPTIAEKPYIAFDEVAKWTLRVPALRTASSGTSWTAGAGPSSSDAVYSFTQVYVATAADSAAAINAKLAAGLHVVLSPGIYELEDTLQLSTPNQVLLGLGLAT